MPASTRSCRAAPSTIRREVSVGTVADPLQLNASSQFSLRDNLTVPVRGGTLNFGVYHNRLNPSLVARLDEQLGLLSPALQQLFLANPVAFVNSSLMPPQLQQLLSSLQPVETQISVSGQFHLGRKWNISPNFSYLRSANSNVIKTNNNSIGYSLANDADATVAVLAGQHAGV